MTSYASRRLVASLVALALSFAQCLVPAAAEGEAAQVQQALPAVQAESALAQMDFSSTARSVEAAQAGTFQSAVLQIGDATRTVTPADMLTPAELVALQQVLGGGSQSLMLDSLGAAAGGTFNLAQALAQQVANLVIPQNVTAFHDFAGAATVNIAGNLTNAGTIYALSTSAATTTATFSAANIVNLEGGLLSSVVPQSFMGFNQAVAALNLNLTAVHDIINHGTIASAGALTATAGGSIINSLPAGSAGPGPVMQAMQAVNLNAANIINSGAIASQTSNINIASQLASSLVVNNAMGALQAASGAINVRDQIASGKFDTQLAGGDWLSKELNVSGGNGKTVIDAGAITGVVNISAHEAHVWAETDNLSIGSFTLTGDPTIVNTGGSVTLSGSPATSGAPFVVAARDDITGTITSINTTGSGAGGVVYLIAGAQVSCSGCGSSQTNPTSTVTISGGSAGGGNITLASLTSINTSASTSGADGGAINLIAFSGSTANTGTITLPTTSTLNSSGNTGAGSSNGNIVVIAGRTSGTAITLGNIETNAAVAASGGGTVTIATAQPELVSDITVTNPNAVGEAVSGGPVQPSATAYRNASVSVGSVSLTTLSALNITAGANVTVGNVTAAAGTGVTTTISAGRGSDGTTAANEGSITITGSTMNLGQTDYEAGSTGIITIQSSGLSSLNLTVEGASTLASIDGASLQAPGTATMTVTGGMSVLGPFAMVGTSTSLVSSLTLNTGSNITVNDNGSAEGNIVINAVSANIHSEVVADSSGRSINVNTTTYNVSSTGVLKARSNVTIAHPTGNVTFAGSATQKFQAGGNVSLGGTLSTQKVVVNNGVTLQARNFADTADGSFSLPVGTLTNNGTITAGSGGSFTMQRLSGSSTILVEGTGTITAGGTLQFVNTSTGTVSLSGNQTLNNASILVRAGNIGISGTVEVGANKITLRNNGTPSMFIVTSAITGGGTLIHSTNAFADAIKIETTSASVQLVWNGQLDTTFDGNVTVQAASIRHIAQSPLTTATGRTLAVMALSGQDLTLEAVNYTAGQGAVSISTDSGRTINIVQPLLPSVVKDDASITTSTLNALATLSVEANKMTVTAAGSGNLTISGTGGLASTNAAADAIRLQTGATGTVNYTGSLLLSGNTQIASNTLNNTGNINVTGNLAAGALAASSLTVTGTGGQFGASGTATFSTDSGQTINFNGSQTANSAVTFLTSTFNMGAGASLAGGNNTITITGAGGGDLTFTAAAGSPQISTNTPGAQVIAKVTAGTAQINWSTAEITFQTSVSFLTKEFVNTGDVKVAGGSNRFITVAPDTLGGNLTISGSGGQYSNSSTGNSVNFNAPGNTVFLNDTQTFNMTGVVAVSASVLDIAAGASLSATSARVAVSSGGDLTVTGGAGSAISFGGGGLDFQTASGSTFNWGSSVPALTSSAGSVTVITTNFNNTGTLASPGHLTVRSASGNLNLVSGGTLDAGSLNQININNAAGGNTVNFQSSVVLQKKTLVNASTVAVATGANVDAGANFIQLSPVSGNNSFALTGDGTVTSTGSAPLAVRLIANSINDTLTLGATAPTLAGHVTVQFANITNNGTLAATGTSKQLSISSSAGGFGVSFSGTGNLGATAGPITIGTSNPGSVTFQTGSVQTANQDVSITTRTLAMSGQLDVGGNKVTIAPDSVDGLSIGAGAGGKITSTNAAADAISIATASALRTITYNSTVTTLLNGNVTVTAASLVNNGVLRADGSGHTLRIAGLSGSPLTLAGTNGSLDQAATAPGIQIEPASGQTMVVIGTQTLLKRTDIVTSVFDIKDGGSLTNNAAGECLCITNTTSLTVNNSSGAGSIISAGDPTYLYAPSVIYNAGANLTFSGGVIVQANTVSFGSGGRVKAVGSAGLSVFSLTGGDLTFGGSNAGTLTSASTISITPNGADSDVIFNQSLTVEGTATITTSGSAGQVLLNGNTLTAKNSAGTGDGTVTIETSTLDLGTDGKILAGTTNGQIAVASPATLSITGSGSPQLQAKGGISFKSGAGTLSTNFGSGLVTLGPLSFVAVGSGAAIDIASSFATGGDNLMLLSEGDITTSVSSLDIDTSGASGGGKVLMVAGAAITGSGPTFTLGAPSATGGSINLAGSNPIDTFTTAGTGTDAPGGAVTLIAIANSGGGLVTLPAGVTLTTGGNGAGAAGAVTVTAGAGSGTVITLGPVAASAGAGGGAVQVLSGNTGVSGATANNAVLGGTPISLPAAGASVLAGSISTQAITANAANITVIAGSNITVAALSSSGSAGSAGNVTVRAGSNSTGTASSNAGTVTLNGDIQASGGGSNGSGGAILLSWNQAGAYSLNRNLTADAVGSGTPGSVSVLNYDAGGNTVNVSQTISAKNGSVYGSAVFNAANNTSLNVSVSGTGTIDALASTNDSTAGTVSVDLSGTNRTLRVGRVTGSSVLLNANNGASAQVIVTDLARATTAGVTSNTPTLSVLSGAFVETASTAASITLNVGALANAGTIRITGASASGNISVNGPAAASLTVSGNGAFTTTNAAATAIQFSTANNQTMFWTYTGSIGGNVTATVGTANVSGSLNVGSNKVRLVSAGAGGLTVADTAGGAIVSTNGASDAIRLSANASQSIAYQQDLTGFLQGNVSLDTPVLNNTGAIHASGTLRVAPLSGGGIQVTGTGGSFSAGAGNVTFVTDNGLSVSFASGSTQTLASNTDMMIGALTLIGDLDALGNRVHISSAGSSGLIINASSTGSLTTTNVSADAIELSTAAGQTLSYQSTDSTLLTGNVTVTTNALANSGNITANSGTLAVAALASGNLTVSGTGTLNAGTGPINIASDSANQITVSGTQTMGKSVAFSTGTLNVTGSVAAGSNKVSVTNSGSLTVQGTGTVTSTNAASDAIRLFTTGSNTLNYTSVTAGLLNGNVSVQSANVNNTGALNANGGTLAVAALAGGGLTLAGTGSMNAGSGPISVSSEAGQTVTVSGAQTFNKDLAISTGGIAGAGSIAAGANKVSVTAAGTTGTLTVSMTGSIASANAAADAILFQTNASQTIDWNAEPALSGNVRIVTGASSLNRNGSAIRALGGTLEIRGVAGSGLKITGTGIFDAGSGSVHVSVEDGQTITVDGGSISMVDASVFTASTLSLLNGALIDGNSLGVTVQSAGASGLTIPVSANGRISEGGGPAIALSTATNGGPLTYQATDLDLLNGNVTVTTTALANSGILRADGLGFTLSIEAVSGQSLLISLNGTLSADAGTIEVSAGAAQSITFTGAQSFGRNAVITAGTLNMNGGGHINAGSNTVSVEGLAGADLTVANSGGAAQITSTNAAADAISFACQSGQKINWNAGTGLALNGNTALSTAEMNFGASALITVNGAGKTLSVSSASLSAGLVFGGAATTLTAPGGITLSAGAAGFAITINESVTFNGTTALIATGSGSQVGLASGKTITVNDASGGGNGLIGVQTRQFVLPATSTLTASGSGGSFSVSSDDTLDLSQIAGTINAAGGISFKSGAGALSASLGTLSGTGAVTFVASGSGAVLNLTSDLVRAGKNLTFLSEGDITTTSTGVDLDTSDATGGGSILMVAGVTVTGAGPTFALGTVSASGGSIDLTASGGIASLTTRGTAGDANGGAIQLIALANGASGGMVSLPAAVTVLSGGSGAGSNGSVTLTGGATGGTAVSAGAITATGGSSVSAGSGSIAIVTGNTAVNGATVTNGVVGGAGFVAPASIADASISAGNLAASSAGITLTAGADITAGNINSNGVANSTGGGTIAVLAGANAAGTAPANPGSLTLGASVTANASAGGTVGDGGSITLQWNDAATLTIGSGKTVSAIGASASIPGSITFNNAAGLVLAVTGTGVLQAGGAVPGQIFLNAAGNSTGAVVTSSGTVGGFLNTSSGTTGDVDIVFTTSGAILRIGDIAGGEITLTSNTGSASTVLFSSSEVSAAGLIDITGQKITMSSSLVTTSSASLTITLTTPLLELSDSEVSKAGSGKIIVQAPTGDNLTVQGAAAAFTHTGSGHNLISFRTDDGKQINWTATPTDIAGSIEFVTSVANITGSIDATSGHFVDLRSAGASGLTVAATSTGSILSGGQAITLSAGAGQTLAYATGDADLLGGPVTVNAGTVNNTGLLAAAGAGFATSINALAGGDLTIAGTGTIGAGAGATVSIGTDAGQKIIMTGSQTFARDTAATTTTVDNRGTWNAGASKLSFVGNGAGGNLTLSSTAGTSVFASTNAASDAIGFSAGSGTVAVNNSHTVNGKVSFTGSSFVNNGSLSADRLAVAPLSGNLALSGTGSLSGTNGIFFATAGGSTINYSAAYTLTGNTTFTTSTANLSAGVNVGGAKLAIVAADTSGLTISGSVTLTSTNASHDALKFATTGTGAFNYSLTTLSMSGNLTVETADLNSTGTLNPTGTLRVTAPGTGNLMVRGTGTYAAGSGANTFIGGSSGTLTVKDAPVFTGAVDITANNFDLQTTINAGSSKILVAGNGTGGALTFKSSAGTSVLSTTNGDADAVKFTASGTFTVNNSHDITADTTITASTFVNNGAISATGFALNAPGSGEMTLAGSGSLSAESGDTIEATAAGTLHFAAGLDWDINGANVLRLYSPAVKGAVGGTASLTMTESGSLIHVQRTAVSAGSLSFATESGSGATTINFLAETVRATVSGGTSELSLGAGTTLSTPGYWDLKVSNDATLRVDGTLRSTLSVPDVSIVVMDVSGGFALAGAGTINAGAGNVMSLSSNDSVFLSGGLAWVLTQGSLDVSLPLIVGANSGVAAIAVSSGQASISSPTSSLAVSPATAGNSTSITLNASSVSVEAQTVSLNQGVTLSANGPWLVNMLNGGTFTNNGILRSSASNNITVSSEAGEALVLAGSGTFRQDAASPAFTVFISDASIQLAAATALNVNSQSTFTVAPVFMSAPILSASSAASITTDGGAFSVSNISGSDAIVFAGGNTINFNGGPFYVQNGTITINSGTTVAASNLIGVSLTGQTPSVFVNNGTLKSTFAGYNLYIIGSGDMEIEGALGKLDSSGGSVAFVSPTRITFDTTVQQFTNSAQIYMSAPVIALKNSQLQALTAALYAITAPGNLEINNTGSSQISSASGPIYILPTTLTNSVNVTGSGTLALNGSGAFFITQPPGSSTRQPTVTLTGTISCSGNCNNLPLLSTAALATDELVLAIERLQVELSLPVYSQAVSGRAPEQRSPDGERRQPAISGVPGAFLNPRDQMPLSALLGSVSMAADRILQREHEGKGLSGEAVVRADSDFDSDTVAELSRIGIEVGGQSAGHYLVLERGAVLFIPVKDVEVRVGEAEVSIEAGSAVYIMRQGDDAAVFNLHDRRHGAVRVLIGNSYVNMRPGQEIVLSARDTADLDKASPGKHVPYRLARRLCRHEGLTVFSAEFSIPAAFGRMSQLRALRASPAKSERRLVSEIVKTAAIQSQLTAARGPFKAAL